MVKRLRAERSRPASAASGSKILLKPFVMLVQSTAVVTQNVNPIAHEFGLTPVALGA